MFAYNIDRVNTLNLSDLNLAFFILVVRYNTLKESLESTNLFDNELLTYGSDYNSKRVLKNPLQWNNSVRKYLDVLAVKVNICW